MPGRSGPVDDRVGVSRAGLGGRAVLGDPVDKLCHGARKRDAVHFFNALRDFIELDGNDPAHDLFAKRPERNDFTAAKKRGLKVHGKLGPDGLDKRRV